MTFSPSQALSFSRSVVAAPFDPERSGTILLAQAYIDLHAELTKLTINENDRLILFAFAADISAHNEWPATAECVERVLAKYGPVT